MDETANEIEAHIDRTRERLGSNLKELEQKVDAATDWREQFRARPYVLLGVACLGGALLATAVRPKSPRRGSDRSHEGRLGSISRSAANAGAQALEQWDTIQGALIGVATARVKEYIGELVPGFDEHVRRAEQRASSR